jgi:hypothetical protein
MKFCLVLLGCLLAGSAFSQKIRESLSMDPPPVIDGNVEEWKADWLMDSKSKFLYNIANDSNNLYVRLKASDPVLQQKVLVFGLTIYLNPEGGSKKGKVGVHYPLKKDLEEAKKEQGGGEPKTWKEMKKDLIKDAEVLELIGLDKHPISTPRLGLMNGLEVMISQDAFGDVIYETKIPFKAFRIDKSKVNDLGITFETGKLVMKQAATTAKPVYYHGVRYAAPYQGQATNEYTSNTTAHANFTLK